MLFRFSLYSLLHSSQTENTEDSGNTITENLFASGSSINGTTQSGETGGTNTTETTVQNYALAIKETIDKMLDPTQAMDEEEQKRYDKRVLRKIHNGEELTAQEMQYIKSHYPELYTQVVRVQMMRKSLKEQLKHCKSKEEVMEVSTAAKLRISTSDPAYSDIMAAYENVTEEFQKSDIYKSLPNTDQEAKDLKKGKRTTGNKNAEEENSNVSNLIDQNTQYYNEENTDLDAKIVEDSRLEDSKLEDSKLEDSKLEDSRLDACGFENSTFVDNGINAQISEKVDRYFVQEDSYIGDEYQA